MSFYRFAITWMATAGLMLGATGCQQQQSSGKPAMAGQCSAGCKCPSRPKPCDRAAACDKTPAAGCPKAGTPACPKSKCPNAAGCALAGTAKCKPACCPSAGVSFLDKANGPKGAGWIALFDGKSLTGWKSMTPNQPMSWSAVDGALVNEKARGVNIYTEQKFGDLEFYAEYKLPENGNSGIFLQGIYEIQIIDDYGVPVDKPKDSGNGGIWSLKPPCKNASKPAGQWQSIHARLAENTVTVILNGEKIIDNFKLERPTFVYDELKIRPGEPGPILIQGDHKPIEYRNIYIRPLKG
ncbi:MAG TPA: family 16 glycoside hydrolase [Phycisphaerae bacterium]|nr:family 16 glycoside hydrolase [Phycisphaerae bacterium]